MSSFGRFTQALGGVVETLSYASPTLSLTQSAGTSPLTATIPSGISGTGTTNYLPKFTGASALGNSVIYQGGSNIGIGETNPTSYPLQVKGADGQGIQYEDASGVRTLLGSYLSKAIIGTLTNNSVGFWSNNSEKITLTATGNVGIGTTSPSYKLDVSSVSRFTGGFYLNESTAGTNAAIYLGSDQTLELEAFGTNGAFAISTGSSVTERMRITSAGNVLIGTTTDSGYKFDCNGIGRISLSAYFGTFNGNNKYYFEPFTNLAGGANNAYMVSGKTDNNERSGFVLQARNSNGDEYNAVIIEGNSSTATSTILEISASGYSTFSGAIAIGNTITSSAPDVNTHKVEIEIGGNTYYLLATENL